MSLVARHLEANGLPTVILGSAIDIVEHCGAARFAFLDFPLGNPCGKPGNAQMQHAVVSEALTLFDTAIAPRTTVRLPWRWPTGEWRRRYMEVRDEDREAMRRKGDERRAERQSLRDAGRVRPD